MFPVALISGLSRDRFTLAKTWLQIVLSRFRHTQALALVMLDFGLPSEPEKHFGRIRCIFAPETSALRKGLCSLKKMYRQDVTSSCQLVEDLASALPASGIQLPERT